MNLLRILAILLLAGAVSGQPPVPKGWVMSPRAEALLRYSGKQMKRPVTVVGPILNVVVPPGKVITLAADFQSITSTNDLALDTTTARIPVTSLIKRGQVVTLTGMQAFIEATEDMSGTIQWTRFTLPYAPQGGTMAVPWTNRTGRVFWRAGFIYPP